MIWANVWRRISTTSTLWLLSQEVGSIRLFGADPIAQTNQSHEVKNQTCNDAGGNFVGHSRRYSCGKTCMGCLWPGFKGGPS